MSQKNQVRKMKKLRSSIYSHLIIVDTLSSDKYFRRTIFKLREAGRSLAAIDPSKNKPIFTRDDRNKQSITFKEWSKEAFQTIRKNIGM